jgi:hypothetical protein
VVRIAATSEPAPGSVTAYAAMIGRSTMGATYFSSRWSEAPLITGSRASPLASIAVPIPVQPQASSSLIIAASTQARPSPPHFAGMWVFMSPWAWAARRTSHGYSIVRSWCSARGRISLTAKS